MVPSTEFRPVLDAVNARKTVTPAPQLDRWWTGFNDPMLATVVKRAPDQNLDLAAALARVQQACAAASAAGAQLLPTVDLDASATAQRQSLQSPLGTVANSFPGYNRYQREYTVGPAASWEIDLFGGLRRGLDDNKFGIFGFGLGAREPVSRVWHCQNPSKVAVSASTRSASGGCR
jgi:outer membrane protein TolC